jgi:hypothetical protein
VWITGNEVVGTGIEVSEVAASATGNGNLLADAVCMLKYNNIAAAFACFNCAKETRRTAADYDDIKARGGGRDLTFVI